MIARVAWSYTGLRWMRIRPMGAELKTSKFVVMWHVSLVS
jgi:hypothetical protein